MLMLFRVRELDTLMNPIMAKIGMRRPTARHRG